MIIPAISQIERCSNFKTSKKQKTDNCNFTKNRTQNYMYAPKGIKAHNFGINFKGFYEKEISEQGQGLIPEASTVWAWDEGAVSYHVYADDILLNLLDGDEDHLKEMAKYLWAASDYDLEEHWTCQRVFLLGFEKPSKSALAFKRFMPYIEAERKKAEELINVIADLEYKKLSGIADLTMQKQEIANALRMMKIQDDSVGTMPYLNGILLYGNSHENRDALSNWIKDSSGFAVQELYFDRFNPKESVQQLREAIKRASNIFSGSGMRTIIDLRLFDQLLTDHSTADNRRLIAFFKSVAEVAAQRYGVTFLLSTNRSLLDFEQAAIGGQRFNIKLNLDKASYLSPEEEIILNNAKKQLDEMKKYAADTSKFTYTRSLDYDEVRKHD